MGFAATLDDLSFPELLHLISFNRKSGRLTVTCREGHALVVFREGRILYAASNRLRESFGYILLRDGIVTELDLAQALEGQNRLEHDHTLGRALVQKGLVAPDDAEKALRQQAQWVITEVFQWRSGFFKFEPPDDGVGGDGAGFDTEELLLEAAAVLDETRGAEGRWADNGRRPARASDAFRVPPEWEGERAASWNSLLHEIRSPSYSGEIVLTLLRYAAQIVSRGVFLLVNGREALSIGQFGIESAAAAARRVWIPLTEPSVFLDVVQGKRTFQGALPHLFWNDHFLEQLGDEAPREAVVVPMLLEGRAAFLLYGDNLPNGAPIGAIQGLEFLMAEAALAMEKLAWDGDAPGRTPRRRSDA